MRSEFRFIWEMRWWKFDRGRLLSRNEIVEIAAIAARITNLRDNVNFETFSVNSLSMIPVVEREFHCSVTCFILSVRPGDPGLQRSGDGDALDDAGRRVLDRCRLRASGAARPVHLLADALSLRKLPGKILR